MFMLSKNTYIYVHITSKPLHFQLTFRPIYKALRCHFSVTFSVSTPHETMHKTRADNCFMFKYNNILYIVAYFILYIVSYLIFYGFA